MGVNMRWTTLVAIAALAVSVPAFAEDECSHFVGTTIAPITIMQAAARLSTLTPKDEFETTAVYEARIATALQTAGGPLIVSKTLEDPKYLEYDADRGVLRIQSYALHNTSFNPSRLWGYGGPLYEKVKFSTIGESVSVAFAKDGRTTGSYVGTNAYGASTRVTKMQADEWGVYDHDLPTYQNIFQQADANSYIGELSVTPDEARKLKLTAKVACPPSAPMAQI
jgi:hypothetical protein